METKLKLKLFGCHNPRQSSSFIPKWNKWLDIARADPECYVSYIPVPHSNLTYKMYEKYKAPPKGDTHTYWTWKICPIDEEPFEVLSRFKKKKDVSVYVGKYFKKKNEIDPCLMRAARSPPISSLTATTTLFLTLITTNLM